MENKENSSVTMNKEENKESPSSSGLGRYPWRVYLAHALSTWGDNMWWFAGGVFMLHLQDHNLRLTAIYGLVIASAVILFGASLGKWIDRTKRLFAAKTFLVIQNTCVSLCAVLLSWFIVYKSENPEISDYWVLLVSVIAIILASVARLASSGVNIIIQKDWIVIIADHDNDKLAKMNSILRTIELTTYMLAPAAGGFLFSYIGDRGTGIFIAAWNIVSVCLEYLLLIQIFKIHPKLADIKVFNIEDQQKAEEDNKTKKNVFKDTYDGWKTYFNHPVRNAGLGLSFLFMTVLGFDNITYGYCLMQGVPHFALGILVGISALVGVLGSLAYPLIREKVGLERSGLLGMFLLISTSSLAVLSVFLPGSPLDLTYQEAANHSNAGNKSHNMMEEYESLTLSEFISKYCSVSVFLLGIILARFGLWIVDLTINQILQERVEESVRGTVNGVQDSLNNSLDLIKCILVIFLPNRETFGLLIILSYVSINIGWLMYCMYSQKQRGHLFHFSQFVKMMCPRGKPKENPILKQNVEVGSKDEKDSLVHNGSTV